MTEKADEQPITKVTFRKRGKAHRGLLLRNKLVAACSCPGSMNGRLTNGAQIVCEGWERANCKQPLSLAAPYAALMKGDHR